MQELIVFGLVTAALLKIGKDIVAASKGRSGCNGCPSGGCGVQQTSHKDGPDWRGPLEV